MGTVESRVACLMGPPGVGKTTMLALTAPRRPVHILDIDRKIGAMGSLKVAKDLSYWELGETLAEEGLAARAKTLSENKKPFSRPRGWDKFAEMVDKLGKDPVSLAAGTWGIDSYTRLGDHLKRVITFYDERGISSLSQRNWGHYLAMHEETITVLIDKAKYYDKDLIVTIHERTSEIPNINTKVRHSKDKDGNMVRELLGDMDLRIAPSVEGAFGLKMFSYFDEVYALRVEMTGSTPRWICRAKPDGRRDLRTSFNVGKEEFVPDFRQIWS